MASLVIPFDSAEDVQSIGTRLHPLDVGFDARAEGMKVAVDDASSPLRVSCADRSGARVVLSGDRAEVIATLRAWGYEVIDRA